MTGKDLFREIGTIKEEYVAEAQDYKRSFVHNTVFQRSLAAAACLVLCVGIYWGVKLPHQTEVMDAAEQVAGAGEQEKTAAAGKDKSAVTEYDEAFAESTESMQDAFIQAETSTTIEGSVREQKVEIFPKHAETQIADSTTEGNAKVEDAPNLPASADSSVMGVQSATPDLTAIKEALKVYPAEFEAICQEDAYIIVQGRIEKGQEKWDAFMTSLKEQKPASIDIVQFTVEGDPIITCLSFDGRGFYVVRDDTRDAWGMGQITENSFPYLYIQVNEYGTEVFLAEEPDLTGEQLESGEYQTYFLFQHDDK